MRIGLISREYPPQTGWGGIGTYTYYLAHALTRLGHEVHVISRSEQRDEYLQRDGDVCVHRVRERKGRGPLSDLLCGLLPISEWRYSQRVHDKAWQLHRQSAFDLFEAPEYAAEPFHLVRHAPTPVVMKLHTPTFLVESLNGSRRTLRGNLVKWMERSTTRRCAWITAPSRSLAELIARAWNIPAERIAVVPNPIHAEGALAEEQPATTPTVLFVGRFEPRKGIHVLMEAIPTVLQAVPQARFVCVGGPAAGIRGQEMFAKELAARVERLRAGERVQFIPWQHRAELQRYYRQCSVVVVPSLYENYPSVCLEAMAHGRAVIGSRAGGIPEIVEDAVTGWLVPPGDHRALAEALVDALTHSERAQRAGQAGRLAAQSRLSPENVARQTAEYYTEVTAHLRSIAPRALRQRLAEKPLRILCVTTERWVDFSKQEGLPVLLAYRQRQLEAQGVTVTWLRFQRLIAPGSARGRVRDAVQKWWEAVSTFIDALHVLDQAHRLRRSFDVVHEWYSLYGISGLLLSRWYRKPLIFEVDALLLEEYTKLQKVPLGRWRSWAAAKLFRMNLRAAAKVIARSQVMADMLEHRWGVARERLAIIPCGLDLARFNAARLSQAHAVAGPDSEVVFLGSLQPWHGCDVLLEAFVRVRREVPQAKLLIIGDGRMRGTLVVKAATLGLDGAVRFIGQVSHESVPGWLARAAVTVAPYPKLPIEFYFSPLKLFEYLGAGKAIVASRIGQLAEVLTHRETGLLVEPGDVEALAEAIVELLRDAPLRERLGQRALTLATEYTWERQAQYLIGIYRGLLASHGDVGKRYQAPNSAGITKTPISSIKRVTNYRLPITK